MATEFNEGPEGGEIPSATSTPEAFAQALGFTPLPDEGEETDEKDRPLRFGITIPPEKKNPDKKEPSGYVLTIRGGEDEGKSVQYISLLAQWEGEDELQPFGEGDLAAVEAFDQKITGRTGGGFSTELLTTGGYDELIEYIQRYVLYEGEQVRDELSGPKQEESVEDKDRRIGQEQKARFFSHEPEEATISETVERFHNAFPEYTHEDRVKDNDIYLFGEVDEDGLVNYIRIYPGTVGFSLMYGRGTVKDKRIKGEVERIEKKIDKKVEKKWVYPLARSATPDIDRSWDAWETGEAIEVLKLRMEELVIDDDFLDRPASWLEEEQRIVSFREFLGYWVDYEMISDKRLKPLGKEAGKIVPFARALTDEQMRAVAEARLEGQRSVELDDTLIIRRQFVEIETAINKLMMGDFKLPSE